MHKAKQFSNTVRYIDDLLTINNPSFLAEASKIYPHELILKKTTESSSLVSYLDTIVEHKCITDIYDKSLSLTL